MTKQDAYGWFNNTELREWDNWSLEEAKFEMSIDPEAYEGMTAEELYELMYQIILEYRMFQYHQDGPNPLPPFGSAEYQKWLEIHQYWEKAPDA